MNKNRDKVGLTLPPAFDMLGGEANISGLKTEDIIIFRLIGGCKDSFLKEKFLKLKSPTLAELKKEATEWEGVRRSMGSTKLHASQEAQARWQPQSKYSKNKNKRRLRLTIYCPGFSRLTLQA